MGVLVNAVSPDIVQGLIRTAESVVVPGEWWECGVWRGGSAQVLGRILARRPEPRVFRLFDTFAGRPYRGDFDGKPECAASSYHTQFSNTTLDDVLTRVAQPFIYAHVGEVPETFVGLEASAIAFAYIDMDLYVPTREALRFIWPRIVRGGCILLDDVDKDVWPGVTRALAEFGVPFDERPSPHQAVLRKP